MCPGTCCVDRRATGAHEHPGVLIVVFIIEIQGSLK